MAPTPLLFIDHAAVFRCLVTRVLLQNYRDTLIVLDSLPDAATACMQHYDPVPAVILLGLGSIPFTDLAQIPQLQQVFPQAQIITLGLIDNAGYRAAARANGATAFVAKEALSTELLATIQAVLATPQ